MEEQVCQAAPFTAKTILPTHSQLIAVIAGFALAAFILLLDKDADAGERSRGNVVGALLLGLASVIGLTGAFLFSSVSGDHCMNSILQYDTATAIMAITALLMVAGISVAAAGRRQLSETASAPAGRAGDRRGHHVLPVLQRLRPLRLRVARVRPLHRAGRPTERPPPDRPTGAAGQRGHARPAADDVRREPLARARRRMARPARRAVLPIADVLGDARRHVARRRRRCGVGDRRSLGHDDGPPGERRRRRRSRGRDRAGLGARPATRRPPTSSSRRSAGSNASGAAGWPG